MMTLGLGSLATRATNQWLGAPCGRMISPGTRGWYYVWQSPHVLSVYLARPYQRDGQPSGTEHAHGRGPQPYCTTSSCGLFMHDPYSLAYQRPHLVCLDERTEGF